MPEFGLKNAIKLQQWKFKTIWKHNNLTHPFKNFFTNISRFGLNNVPNMCYNICMSAASDCLQKKFWKGKPWQKDFWVRYSRLRLCLHSDCKKSNRVSSEFEWTESKQKIKILRFGFSSEGWGGGLNLYILTHCTEFDILNTDRAASLPPKCAAESAARSKKYWRKKCTKTTKTPLTEN